ncbi:MAG: hypothetical protein AB7I36_00050 [Rhodospirillaceae bacterium]
MHMAAIQSPQPWIVLVGISLAFHNVADALSVISTTAAAAERAIVTSEEASISDQELESFAKAKAKVDEITAFWAESIERSSAREVLQGVRDNEIEIAVGLEDLTLDRYREIEQAAKKSAELKEAIDMLAADE